MTGALLLADNKNNNLIAQVVAMVMQFDTASQNKIIQGNKTMRSITFYDKNGDPFCYTEDDCHIYKGILTNQHGQSKFSERGMW